MTFRRFEKMLHTPLALMALVALGMAFGLNKPDWAVHFKPLTEFYLSLLKMVILPFLISSIIFGLRSLVKNGSTDRTIFKLLAAFIGVSLIAVTIGGSLAMLLQPGKITDPVTLTEFGRIVSQSGSGTDLQMRLHDPLPEAAPNPLLQMLLQIVPSNVFQALAAGDIVKVLVFAVLFGLAVGRVPDRISDSFGNCLETIYRTCMILTGWFTRFLPILTFAMVAQHTADVGKDTLLLMVNFLTTMAISAVIVIAISMAAIVFRSGQPLSLVIRRGQDIAGMSLSTNSSTACIPVVIDSLIKLGFRRDAIELVVPLSTALIRAGSIICYVVAPLFIAQLYGRTLNLSELSFLFASAALLGATTSGQTGILMLMQIGIICQALNLPFEAAFVLLASVDSFSDSLRTLMLVFTAAGASAMITSKGRHTDAVERVAPFSTPALAHPELEPVRNRTPLSKGHGL